MKKFLLLASFCTLFLFPYNGKAQVTCNAMWNDSTAGVDAYFYDLSTNAAHWNWTFGDGYTDTVQNPFHSYATNGTYFVCLSITNAAMTCTAASWKSRWRITCTATTNGRATP